MAEKQIYTFTNEIDEVEISALCAKITVESTDSEAITAEYENTGEKPEFCAVLSNKKVVLKEIFKLGMICNICSKSGESTINVKLPKKLYSLLKIKTASGGVEISDTAVTAENFSLETASGEINITAFFPNVKIKTASGKVTLENPTGSKAENVDVAAVSGEVTIKGYPTTGKYKISSASGKTVYTDAAGDGEINVTSGNIEVDYSDWSGDLKIGAVSGNVKVTLPKESGINVKFDGVSGLVKTDLGGEPGRFMNLGKGTNGEFGGSNKRNVAVNLISGTVTLASQQPSVEKEVIIAE